MNSTTKRRWVYYYSCCMGTNNMGGASLSEAGSPGTATWGTTGTSYASVTKFTN